MGRGLQFIQRYRSGFPENLGEQFDAPFARLDWISPDRFDIQWHRHTGEWFRLHRGLTLVKAIETLGSNGILHSVGPTDYDLIAPSDRRHVWLADRFNLPEGAPD